jgi:hypothetical protein
MNIDFKNSVYQSILDTEALYFDSKFDRDCVLFQIIAPTKFQPMFRFKSLSAYSFFGTKLMSNEKIFRITVNILSFQPYLRNKHNLLCDTCKILSSVC